MDGWVRFHFYYPYLVWWLSFCEKKIMSIFSGIFELELLWEWTADTKGYDSLEGKGVDLKLAMFFFSYIVF